MVHSSVVFKMEVYQVFILSIFLVCGVQAISGKLGPDCGLKRTNLEGKSIYPWQVAIFKKFNGEEQFICGGTLLTTNIILTAAHCVTKEKGNDIAVSPENFTVFAGKSYLDKDETTVQSSKVNKIIPAEYWRGSLQNYAFDLALLILSREFKLSQGVQMICRDTSNDVSLNPKEIGIITGWGITKPDQVKISNELQEIPIPIVGESVCKNELPASFLKYYSEDKFCAGYYNQTKGVCQGFGGGGLYFEKDGRHYIKGILSVSPVTNGKCDLQQYGLYTNLAKFDSFIDQAIIENS